MNFVIEITTIQRYFQEQELMLYNWKNTKEGVIAIIIPPASCVGRKVKHRHKVKSGAKVKQRPVVRTELWPHTIANEEDGEEVTSENIGLSRFLSCFTFIMTNCGRREAAGRAEFLHAITNVLECLPWSDARAFHNMIMVRLEQDRVDWLKTFTYWQIFISTKRLG